MKISFNIYSSKVIVKMTDQDKFVLSIIICIKTTFLCAIFNISTSTPVSFASGETKFC